MFLPLQLGQMQAPTGVVSISWEEGVNPVFKGLMTFAAPSSMPILAMMSCVWLYMTLLVGVEAATGL